MASSKLLNSFFVVIFSLSFVGYAQQAGGGGGGSGGGTSLPCVQKLLPCQPALASHSTAPPAACCIPLKQLVMNDPKCLCAVLNNAALLKNFNITQDDALTLAKKCNANADMSVCKTAGGPTVAPVTPTPSTPSASNSSSAANSTGSPSNTAAGVVVGGFGKSVLFLVLSVVGSI